MSFPFYIAKRYVFAKSGNNTINIITLIASIGVIVGALSLFIILSGFSGFRTFTFSLLDKSDPDIRIRSTKGKSFFYTDSFETYLISSKEVVSVAKVIEERALFQHGEKELIAYVKGVSTNFNSITKIDSTILFGQWLDPKFKNTAVIGYGIANKFTLGVLSTMQIHVPKPGKGMLLNASAAYNTEEVSIAGVYSGLEEFANKYAFVNLNLAQELLGYQENQITSLELKLKEGVSPETVAASIQKVVGEEFTVATRLQFNAMTYKVLNTESLVSYFIFSLIIIIALFNVIGTIIMMIIEKRNNLKTLFNLGVSVSEIKSIFIIQGFLLTLVSLLIGLSIGVLLVFLQNKFQFFMITESIPYPIEFRFKNLIIVALTIVILGYIASVIASSRITKKFIEKSS